MSGDDVVSLLEVGGLTYGYPGSREAVLHGLHFEVREGEIIGLLGPNGSGKTTTQLLLTRVIQGFEGTVRVFGKDLEAFGPEYYEEIGICFENPNLYEKLTADENLSFFRGFFSRPGDEIRALLERLDLPVGDVRQVRHFSKGMRMRVALARSLLNRPRLWFLDEPTGGQDPDHAVEIRSLIREQAETGTTVFLTTHNMVLADELCDRVAFLVQGRIDTIDSPRSLKLAHTEKRVRVAYRNEEGTREREFSLERSEEMEAFFSVVRSHEIETIHTQEPSLEDVFLRVTGRTLR